MGNQVSIDSTPIDLVNIAKLKSIFDESKIPRKQFNFTSNIKIWSLLATKNAETIIKPVNIQHLTSFDQKLSYIILHIFTRQQLKIDASTQEKSIESKKPSKSLFKLAVSSAEYLSPRGLEHRFSINEISLFAQTAKKDSLLYDLYIWNGKDSSPLTKAVAITKGFELERYLLGEHILDQLFEMGNPKPITEYFIDDVLSLKSNSKEMNTTTVSLFMTLYQNSHLFRKLVDSSNHIKAEIPSENEDTDTTIRSLLQMPTLQSAILAFPETGINEEAPEYQASPKDTVDEDIDFNDAEQDKLFREIFLASEQIPETDYYNPPDSIELSLDTPRHVPQVPNIPPLVIVPPTKPTTTRKRTSEDVGFDESEESRRKSPRSIGSRGSFDSANSSIDRSSLSEIDRISTNRTSKTSTTMSTHRRLSLKNFEKLRKSPHTNSSRNSSTREIERFLPTRPMSGPELVVYYRKICSQIRKYLYLGSDIVARSKEQLQSNGITHIVNAANIVCRDYFPESFKYCSFSLYDSGSQSIIGLFFTVINFVEEARQQGGRTFIHCFEGVSRSSACCIAYLMWKEKLTFNAALEDVKEKRAVCSPNAGFIVQLLQWENIILQTRPETYMYRISPLNDRYHEHKQVAPQLCASRTLDSRTCFIVHHSDGQVYIWIGSKASQNIIDEANKFAVLLKTYLENVKDNIEVIKEGEVNEKFMDAVSCVPEKNTSATPYPDLALFEKKAETPVVEKKPEIEIQEEQESKLLKGKLYAFPEWDDYGTFDSDDLDDNKILVLKPDHEKFIFVWIGESIKGADEEFGRMKGKLFLEMNGLPNNTEIRVVFGGEEPDEFLDYFDG